MDRRTARWVPSVFLVAVAAAALIVGAQRTVPASIPARARVIAEGIRCPTCEGQTVANSQTFAAKAIEADIVARLRAGESPAGIRSYLVSRYGPSILESPPLQGVAVLVWVLPAVAVPTAAVVLVVELRRRRPRRPAGPVSDEDRDLVAAMLHPQAADAAAAEGPSSEQRSLSGPRADKNLT